jgi:hypothetical protein
MTTKKKVAREEVLDGTEFREHLRRCGLNYLRRLGVEGDLTVTLRICTDDDPARRTDGGSASSVGARAR